MNIQVIRAVFDENSITVYQAYNQEIANSACDNQTFLSPPFKKERMTWIKPSFLWMMYRSGWASKTDQERILAIKLKRGGFEWCLANACLSHYDQVVYPTYEDWKRILNTSPVRIQWDPEKDIHMQPLPYRSIQIGLTGIAVEKYVSEWILQIDDITENCRQIQKLIVEGRTEQAKDRLPIEQLYPLPENFALKINSY